MWTGSVKDEDFSGRSSVISDVQRQQEAVTHSPVSSPRILSKELFMHAAVW